MSPAEDRVLREVIEVIGAAAPIVESEHLRAHLTREVRFLRVCAGMPPVKVTRPYVPRLGLVGDD